MKPLVWPKVFPKPEWREPMAQAEFERLCLHDRAVEAKSGNAPKTKEPEEPPKRTFGLGWGK
jgi:hypothetical protein